MLYCIWKKKGSQRLCGNVYYAFALHNWSVRIYIYELSRQAR